MWTDTVLTTKGFYRTELCNRPSVGTLCGYMQDAIAQDSAVGTSTPPETTKTHHGTAEENEKYAGQPMRMAFTRSLDEP